MERKEGFETLKKPSKAFFAIIDAVTIIKKAVQEMTLSFLEMV
ncbi:putative cytosolic protein [Streptococcus pyogenes]|nr:putative cytosolic protein [Streptococcus pyogenes]